MLQNVGSNSDITCMYVFPSIKRGLSDTISASEGEAGNLQQSLMISRDPSDGTLYACICGCIQLSKNILPLFCIRARTWTLAQWIKSVLKF